MLDATRGIEGQDLNIFSLIQRNQKGLVVVVNKWDLVENKNAKVENGVLADVAPSILHILGMPQPADMTGRDLIK